MYLLACARKVLAVSGVYCITFVPVVYRYIIFGFDATLDRRFYRAFFTR